MRALVFILLVGAALADDVIPANLPEEFLQVLKKPVFQPRIIGGDYAASRQFPYQVGISTQKGRSYFWCGGSVISKDYVLTAAHCVFGEIQSILLIFGATDRANPVQIGSARQNITHIKDGQIIIHPLYNPQELINDIALIRLNQKLEFSEFIKPARLPEIGQLATYDNSPAVLSGWGKTQDKGSVVQFLQYGYVTILDLNKCMQFYETEEYDHGNICLDVENSGVSSCNGDSGGPLVSTVTGELIGVTSYGSKYGCEKGYPTGYTRVTHFRKWINYHTGI